MNKIENRNEIKIIASVGSFYNIQAKNGDILIVQIYGNPTTGYEWCLDIENSSNNDSINPLNLNENGSGLFVSDANEKAVCGIGGNYIFKFLLTAEKGKYLIITLKYERPWETNLRQSSKTSININIK